ncbi:hypothetical protein OVY01_05140 [Robbsia sp. Bb-Pol-6]|uniref:Uncharacterized protein n=1 Tax=Robbsia betulipollinis TaxID=2981849 RepID=A0ABT3ZJE2_9BURK|nr:hypothetical protein [Robbsia betulipollinis]MCY0386631.1 hypothetical protein [Robbsia betulipollinis]
MRTRAAGENRADLFRLPTLADVPENGLALSSGSLGDDLENDLPARVREFRKRGRPDSGLPDRTLGTVYVDGLWEASVRALRSRGPARAG